MSQVANDGEMQESGRPAFTDVPHRVAGRVPHRGDVAAVSGQIPQPGPGAVRRLYPSRGRANTDAQTVVLAYQQKGQGEMLV